MNPHRSGSPIGSINTVRPLYYDLPRQKQFYQSIVGCINWIATCTCPYIAPALTFLASYSNAPHPKNYKAAVHGLKYLTSTNEYGIYFHSNPSSMIQVFNHYPRHHNKEAYTEATATSPSECHQLTAIYNANWVVNSEVQSKKALLSNCVNSTLSLVFSYGALAVLLHGNQHVKTKPP